MLLSARHLAGMALIGSDGRTIGTIREVVVERHQGKLIYALMQAEAATGTEDRGEPGSYPLPWPLLEFEPDGHRFRLKADPEHLQRAPGGGNTEAPIDWEDRVWAERLHEHYGLQPYWTPR